MTGYGSIALDSVHTTASTCADNGTITIYATASSSLRYTITAGPVTAAQQASDEFVNLASGAYHILVTDFSADTLVILDTVKGSYVSPNFTTTTYNPQCPRTATGTIIGHASAGASPYTWVLTNLSTNLSTTQPSDTFTSLIAGSYSLRLYDSCQNYASYNVTLSSPDDTFIIAQITNRVYTCDSVSVDIELQLAGTASLPYTIKVGTHNGTYQHVVTDYVPYYYNPSIFENVGGVSYGDSINVTITDACGYSVYKANTVASFTIGCTFVSVAAACQVKYEGEFYAAGDPSQSHVNGTYMAEPLTVTVSTPTGTFIDSTVTNSSNHFTQYALSAALQAGQAYQVKITDQCGNSYTSIYQWPNQPTPSFTSSLLNGSCLDSTAGVSLSWQSTFYSLPTFRLLSGPTHIQSTKQHYAYYDTIIYPQTHLPTAYQQSYFVQLANLAVGTYVYMIFDTCGNSITDSFSITPQNLNNDFYQAHYVKGCPGQNAIIVTSDRYASGTLNTTALNYSGYNVINNLNAGNSILVLQYGSTTYAQAVNHTLSCQVIRDTINIPAYQSPQASFVTQASCHGSVYTVLQADSATGVPPYHYQILTGPETTGVQTSNVFLLNQPGSYEARITDSCGFAGTYIFLVDTTSFVSIDKVGASCLGGNVTLSNSYSPYASYTWIRPDGTTYIGDSLNINPILPMDYGTYHITKRVNVDGCRDTFYMAYVLTGTGSSNITGTICPGQSISFGPLSISQPGVYYDTIPTSGCDSIVTLTLTVGHSGYDSVSQTICAGQSITVGNHTYTASGVYRDTFATSSCDSIHVLNLQVNGYKTSAISEVVCYGQSIQFGSMALSQAGTYYDTIPTSGCDSIVTLTLTTAGSYDSVSQSICTSQSVTVGNNTYATTGLYRDTFTVNGCDSIYVLNLQVSNFKSGSALAILCPGQTVQFGNVTLSQAGTYYDTIPTTGCDSIVTLTLTAGGAYDSVSQTICPGQSVTVGNNTYTATAIYRDTFTTSGCDSIHILNLTANSYKSGTDSVILCPGQTVHFGNALLTQAGIYYDTIPTATCDSIVTLTLTAGTYSYDSAAQTICAGQSVTVGNNTYTTTGIYRDTLATTGCDSIYVLNLLVMPYKTGFDSAVLCPGQMIQFGAVTLSQAGIYYDTIPTTGCDSIVTLTLTAGSYGYDSVSQTICAGQSVTVANNTYMATGIYKDTFATTGCDSIYVLNLLVNGYKTGTASAILCPGQTIQFGNLNLSQGGTYYDTIPTTGCDSIVTLTLTAGNYGYDSVLQSICPGQSVAVGNHTYSTTGIYRDTFATSGCDSIYVLNLYVNGFKTGSVSAVLCPGQNIQFGNALLTQAGTYYDTIPTTGCDSIVTLTLTAGRFGYDSVSQNICAGQSVAVGNNTYTTTGIYKDTFATVGCDSIFVLNLQVGAPKTGTFSQSICEGSSLDIGTHSYTQAGTYLDTMTTAGGCDSIVTIQVTIIPAVTPTATITVSTGPVTQQGLQTDTFSVSYTDCPNPYFSWYLGIVPLGIHTQVAVINFPPALSDSVLCRIDCNNECPAYEYVYSNSYYTSIGNQIAFIQGVNIYPNPTQGSFSMEINTNTIEDRSAQISVINMIGQSVFNIPLTLHSGSNKEMLTLDESAAAGVYIIQLSVGGRSLYYRLVLDK